MSRGHLIFLSVFIAALAALYLFGQTKPESLREDRLVETIAEEEPSFSFESYIEEVLKNIDSTAAVRIYDLQLSLREDTANEVVIYRKLVSQFDKYNSAVSGYYLSKLAETTNEKKDWIEAGDRFSNIIGLVENPEVSSAFSSKALYAFNKALAYDSSNLDVRVRISNVHLESGGDNIMKGVTGLLDVLKTDPDNNDANLLLGKFGIISGQFDKAITRLEKVVSSQPQNVEAMFLLAEAYRGVGRRDEAVAMLERCKKEVSDEDLAIEIEAYIDKIK